MAACVLQCGTLGRGVLFTGGNAVAAHSNVTKMLQQYFIVQYLSTTRKRLFFANRGPVAQTVGCAIVEVTDQTDWRQGQRPSNCQASRVV
jgi:hypothetical protein